MTCNVGPTLGFRSSADVEAVDLILGSWDVFFFLTWTVEDLSAFN